MKKLFFSVGLLSLVYSTGFDLEDGAPIRQGVHIEWYRTVAPGNEGEAIFVWSDTRYGMRNIFAHKINQNGELLWGETGAVITDLPGRQEDPVSITDGNGGAFIAWVDYRFDAEGDIFIQHVDTDGNLLMNEDGIALAQVSGKQITINMCTDSLGGVFITWQDKRGGVDDDIYGTHVTYDHEIIAPGTGVPIVTAGGNQNAKSIEYSGNNEAFIAWADYRDGANADIFGQRIDVNMLMTFQNNGIAVASTTEQEVNPRVTFVNNNQSIIVWKRGDENSRIYYQFINSEGLVFENEKQISNYDALQTKPRVKRSSIGEVFVNWTDLRDDDIDGDQYFQKINNNGDIQWGDGVQLHVGSEYDFSARFSAGSSGDLNIVYELGVFPEVDIIFQNISVEGNLSINNPLNISNSDGYQFSPIILGDTNLGLYIIYADQGSGSIDLRVQKIDSNLSVEWEAGGLVTMLGLDGDVNFTNNFRVSEEDFFLVWEDNRASKKIYGTRITNENSQALNGAQLTFSDNSSQETDSSTPVVIKTNDAIYTATFDGSSSPKSIRINKINNNLNNEWGTSGIALSPEQDMRSAFLIEMNDEIGCFWSESRGFNYDIYYQRLDSDGNIQMQPGGIEMIDGTGDDYVMAVVPSNDDKYFMFWVEDSWPAAKLMYTKIDSDGNVEIGWNPNGNNLSTVGKDARSLEIEIIDEENGLLAVWTQSNLSGTSILPTDIYAQVIDWNGNTAFDAGGVPVTQADNDQINFDFALNHAKDKAMLVWEDYRNGQNYEIIGQVLDLENGALINDPVQFTNALNDSLNNYNPVITNVMQNEYFVIWEDSRGYINEDPLLINGVDLYGSGFKIGSGLTTPINGIPICIAYHKQQDVNITHHVDEEFFLDWIDYRSSGKEDLANYYGRTIMKAELLSTNPSCYDCELPEEFSLKPAYPNPFNGSVIFEYEVPSSEAIEFAIYDIKGSKVMDKLILPGFGGKYKVNWDGKDINGSIVSSGVYFYNFSTSSTIAKGKITYIK